MFYFALDSKAFLQALKLLVFSGSVKVVENFVKETPTILFQSIFEINGSPNFWALNIINLSKQKELLKTLNDWNFSLFGLFQAFFHEQITRVESMNRMTI